MSVDADGETLVNNKNIDSERKEAEESIYRRDITGEIYEGAF